MDKLTFENVLKRLNVAPDYIRDVARRTIFNETISEYFELLFDEFGEDKYLTLAERIHDCSRRWHVDKYNAHKIYDVTYISRCKSKFCWNCQKMIQASRLSRFSDFMIDASKSYDLFHIVFTVPNCTGFYLKATINAINAAFKRLIKFFDLRTKIAGVDFSQYGFSACIKSFEITCNRITREFHPHLHCIFAFNKGLSAVPDFDKTNINSFSFSSHSLTRYFSNFEVFLQKLWRLLFDSEIIKHKHYSEMYSRLGPVVSSTDPEYAVLTSADFSLSSVKPNRERITLNAINALTQGYSCAVDYIEDGDELNFYEVFKYAFKLCSEDSVLLDYDFFRDLYFATKGLRSIQGYGKWYNLCLNDDIDESVDEFYNVVQAYLRQSDTWSSLVLDVDELAEIADKGEYTVITRKSIQRYLNDLSSADKLKLTSLSVVPRASDKKIYYSNLSLAYYRYLDHKKTSPLFASLGRQYVSKTETDKPLLVLTNEQLSFLDSIF